MTDPTSRGKKHAYQEDGIWTAIYPSPVFGPSGNRRLRAVQMERMAVHDYRQMPRRRGKRRVRANPQARTSRCLFWAYANFPSTSLLAGSIEVGFA